jgi:hypothetical protein
LSGTPEFSSDILSLNAGPEGKNSRMDFRLSLSLRAALLALPGPFHYNVSIPNGGRIL